MASRPRAPILSGALPAAERACWRRSAPPQSTTASSPALHCTTGAATLDRFDLLRAIVDWVEGGKAPDAVIATGPAFPRPQPAALRLPTTCDIQRVRAIWKTPLASNAVIEQP